MAANVNRSTIATKLTPKQTITKAAPKPIISESKQNEVKKASKESGRTSLIKKTLEKLKSEEKQTAEKKEEAVEPDDRATTSKKPVKIYTFDKKTNKWICKEADEFKGMIIIN